MQLQFSQIASSRFAAELQNQQYGKNSGDGDQPRGDADGGHKPKGAESLRDWAVDFASALRQ